MSDSSPNGGIDDRTLNERHQLLNVRDVKHVSRPSLLHPA